MLLLMLWSALKGNLGSKFQPRATAKRNDCRISPAILQSSKIPHATCSTVTTVNRTLTKYVLALLWNPSARLGRRTFKISVIDNSITFLRVAGLRILASLVWKRLRVRKAGLKCAIGPTTWRAGFRLICPGTVHRRRA